MITFFDYQMAVRPLFQINKNPKQNHISSIKYYFFGFISILIISDSLAFYFKK